MRRFNFNKIICGCDEAGRGSLAGPVVAGAVILSNRKINNLNDSKKLSKKAREELNLIIKKHSIAWGIGVVDNTVIDEINILNASIKAMHLAIESVVKKIAPQLLIIDGNKFKKYNNIEHKCIIKGDSQFQSIAAASIIAKSHRDKMMDNLSEKYNEYKWGKNKGYPTKEHKLAISKFGITKYHRKSYKLFENQFQLKF